MFVSGRAFAPAGEFVFPHPAADRQTVPHFGPGRLAIHVFTANKQINSWFQIAPNLVSISFDGLVWTVQSGQTKLTMTFGIDRMLQEFDNPLWPRARRMLREPGLRLFQHCRMRIGMALAESAFASDSMIERDCPKPCDSVVNEVSHSCRQVGEAGPGYLVPAVQQLDGFGENGGRNANLVQSNCVICLCLHFFHTVPKAPADASAISNAAKLEC